jgi:hypothetical protein
MAKLHLNVGLEIDFHLIGISCHLKDYRFIWHINNALKSDFCKTEFYEHFDNKLFFSNFKYNIDNQEVYIISNKSQGGYLLKKTKQIDYWLKVNHNIDNNMLDGWMEEIIKIDDVLAITRIETNKQKEYFIF